MSWLTGYIGKAESLLNALDSSASELLATSSIDDETAPAVAAGGADTTPPLRYQSRENLAPTAAAEVPTYPTRRPSPPLVSPSPTSASNPDGFALESSRLSQQLLRGSTGSPKPQSSDRTDEALLDFLNAPTPKSLASSSTLKANAAPVSGQPRSRKFKTIAPMSKTSESSIHSTSVAAVAFPPRDEDSDGSSGASSGSSGAKTHSSGGGDSASDPPPFIQIPTSSSMSRSSSSSMVIVSPQPPQPDTPSPVNAAEQLDPLVEASVAKSRSSSGESLPSRGGAASGESVAPTPPLLESEPEMIPTPPSGVMTSSQESDCEILSAGEVALIESAEPRRDLEIVVESAQRSDAVKSGVPGVEASVEAASLGLSVSKLQLENQLLRSEIKSLNEEMQGAWHQAQLTKEEHLRVAGEVEQAKRRYKELEKGRSEAERRAAMAEERARELDDRTLRLEQRLKEAAGRSEDSAAAIDAKDGQLAVLRVRLAEADEKAARLGAQIESLDNENRRLLKDHDVSMATHSNAFQALESSASQMEEKLERKNKEFDRLESELATLQRESAEEKAGLASMITSLQAELGAEKNRATSLQHQLAGSQRSAEAARKELSEYRAKATRTLQAKEKLIASLKEGGGGESSRDAAAALEIDGVRSERDLLREEVDSLRLEMETARMELAESEAQAARDQDVHNEQMESINFRLKETEERLNSQTFDISKLQQELACAHDELHRAKIGFQSTLTTKDEEAAQLRKRLEAREVTAAAQPHVEQRLQALTENLIEKQTTIESLSTERSSLKLQLERMQAAAAAAAASTASSAFSASIRSSAVHVAIDNDDRDVTKMRLPPFLRESPQDTGVARGVKRAASTLDTLGVRIGVFFRRYPVARVLAIVYAGLLHLWVVFILLTYTPEMH